MQELSIPSSAQPRVGHKLGRMATAASILLVGMGLVAAGLPAVGASERSNFDIKWSSGGEPVLIPAPGYAAPEDQTLVGCAGTAYLTFPTGQAVTVVGAALGPDACQDANPPCIPYAAASPTITCQMAGTYCCIPIYSPNRVYVGIGEMQPGCLRTFWLVWDVDGDPSTPGTPGSDGYEFRFGPFVALGPPNPGSDYDCS